MPGLQARGRGGSPLRSKAERLIADTLFEMYKRSNGGMGYQEWNAKFEEMRETLVGNTAEKIARSEDSTAEFVPLTVEELDLVTRIWIAGSEQALTKVLNEEKAHEMRSRHAAS